MTEKEEELEQIRAWCDAAIGFMRQHDPSPKWFFDSMQGIVSDVIDAQDLRGARQMRREVAEMVGAMSRDDVRRLDQLLFEKFGKGLKSRRPR